MTKNSKYLTAILFIHSRLLLSL